MLGREIELKAGLAGKDMRDVLRLLKAGYGPGQPPVHLRGIYYDTAGGALHARGMALRLRHENGHWIQTIKAGRTGTGGFQDVAEHESLVAGPKPRIEAVADPVLRAEIDAATRDAPLVRQFETRVRRTVWMATERHGQVEIALDRGLIIAAGRSVPIAEVELELKGGAPEALFDLADRLLRRTGANLALPSKAARGHALAAGRALDPRPLPSRLPPLAPEMPAGAGFEAILQSLAASIAANLHATMVSDDPEGPHQLRVALRRLRACLRLFSGIVDHGVLRDLNHGARDLGRAVSSLRDFDAMCAVVLGAQPGHHAQGLHDALLHYRADLAATTRAQLRDNGATRFALLLLRLSNLGGWQAADSDKAMRPLAKLCRKPLARLWGELTPLGDHLSILSKEGQHRLRKGLKEYRYIIELIKVNTENNVEIKELKRLQAALGTLMDLAVLAEWRPLLQPREAADSLDAARRAVLNSSRQRADLALGRACRHWLALRIKTDLLHIT